MQKTTTNSVCRVYRTLLMADPVAVCAPIPGCTLSGACSDCWRHWPSNRLSFRHWPSRRWWCFCILVKVRHANITLNVRMNFIICSVAHCIFIILKKTFLVFFISLWYDGSGRFNRPAERTDRWTTHDRYGGAKTTRSSVETYGIRVKYLLEKKYTFWL